MTESNKDKLTALSKPLIWFTLEEAVSLANEKKVRILSNLEVEARILKGQLTEYEKYSYTLGAGTLIAYVEPNKSFKEANPEEKGAYVVYTDPETKITYRFPVPKKFRNIKNAALVIEHGFDEQERPHFEIKQSSRYNAEIHVNDEKNIGLIKKFPQKNGWYETDSKYGIPTGKYINHPKSTTRSFRRADRKIGFIRRFCYYENLDYRYCVAADFKSPYTVMYAVPIQPSTHGRKKSLLMPENVFFLSIKRLRLTLEEAVSLANEKKLILVSNKSLENSKIETELFKGELSDTMSWTGTLIAYVEPNKSFKEANPEEKGAYVVYTDPETKITYRFPVPKKFRNIKNAALVIEHGFDEQERPHFEIKPDGKDKRIFTISDESKIQILADFPVKLTQYHIDDKFAIPTAATAKIDNKEVRFLKRENSIITLVARDWGLWGKTHSLSRQYVRTDRKPSETFAVLAYSSSTDLIGEFESPLIRPEDYIPSQTETGSALLEAAERETSVDIKRILESDPNITKGINLDSPLIQAAYRGNIETVLSLLQKGADINAVGSDGSSLLHYAAYWGHFYLLDLLIKKGLGVNNANNEGFTPLHRAILGLENALRNVYERDYVKRIYEEYGEIVDLLIEKRAKINAKDNNSLTPLHYSILYNMAGISASLIRNGGKIDAKAKDSTVLLHRTKYAEIANWLIKKGLDVDSRDKLGLTPLHAAIYYGNSEVAALLVKKGAKVNAKNNEGFTPLHYAAHHDRVGIAILLIENGASLNIKNDYGYIPLDYAKSGEMKRLLKK